MKILGICASPRKKQTTYAMLEAALNAAAEVEGVETELIELAGKKFGGCLACGKCMKELTCSQDDDFKPLLPRLADPAVAGLIIASPVYFGGMTGQCKAFIDRCVPLRRNGFLLAEKVGGAIAVGGVRNGGQELTIQAIHAAMLVWDMTVVSDGKPTAHFGGTGFSALEGGIAADEFGLTTARSLGGRVARLAAKLYS